MLKTNQSKNIVIVEDDKSSLKAYKKMIEEHILNCNVVPFTSVCNELFDFIRDTHIDLFIVDINLGIHNGIELSKNFLKSMTGLTFLFVSGYNPDMSSFEVFDGKCIYDYMPKPFGLEELVIRVRALLNISKSYNRVIEYIEKIKNEFCTISTDNLRNEYFERLHEDKQMIEKLKAEILKI